MRQRDPKNALPSKVRAQYADEEEHSLIARVKITDHEAFEALFHRYLGRVYRQAIRLLGDQAPVPAGEDQSDSRRPLSHLPISNPLL